MRSPACGPRLAARRHGADDSINKAVRRLTGVDLIVVDDIGMLRVGEDAAEGFYRLVDACYEKRSLAVSSNLHAARFDEITPKDAGHRDRRPAAATPTSASPTGSRSGSRKSPPARK